MSRAQLIDATVGGVLSAALDDFRKGRIDETDLLEMGRRRYQHIRDEFMATAGRAAPSCATCGAAATTRLAGRDYCDPHAATAPRLAPPSGVGPLVAAVPPLPGGAAEQRQ